MKNLLVALFLLLSVGALAQSGGVKLDSQAQMAIDAQKARSKVVGYRVCVFSDNSQSARGAASAAMARLAGSFDLSANVVYQNPFFKVYAGHCLNRLEASMLLGRLKTIFPSAFIVGEQMSISSFDRGISVGEVAVPATEDGSEL